VIQRNSSGFPRSAAGRDACGILSPFPKDCGPRVRDFKIRFQHRLPDAHPDASPVMAAAR